MFFFQSKLKNRRIFKIKTKPIQIVHIKYYQVPETFTHLFAYFLIPFLFFFFSLQIWIYTKNSNCMLSISLIKVVFLA